MKKLNIKIGDKYGRYSIVKEVERVGYDRHFLCLCECGTKKIASLRNLRKGNTQSCGCLQKERAIEAAKKRIKHGMYGTPTYYSYQAMK